MPRSPEHAPAVEAIAGGVFSPLADRLREHAGPIFPLHVGDTWMEPFEGGRMEDLRTAEHPGMHRYVDTRGIPPLLDAAVEKLRARNRLDCERENVLATGGATGGLAAAVASIVSPGEEVLILAPFWPLIRGIVQSFRGVPVEVPFYDRVGSAEEAVAAVRARLSPRTAALYVSTPSNPTGRVLP
ncbi:MAG TPA: aminotransferase class I/II-fold pyridoxal phosphate-dependent enzyme, partial [Myxococcota bacterium]|nr:aminotransferase class I/II-fold pyridoxal phosphate-dependent enzyme [Myxococcota bacterium]